MRACLAIPLMLSTHWRLLPVDQYFFGLMKVSHDDTYFKIRRFEDKWREGDLRYHAGRATPRFHTKASQVSASTMDARRRHAH